MSHEPGSHTYEGEHDSISDKLLNDERFMQVLIDGSKRYILLLRPDGIIVRANRSVLQAINKKREEIEGKHVFHVPELTGPISAERPINDVIKRIIHGEDCNFEMFYCLGEGRKVYLDCSMQTLTDGNGDPSMLIVEGWNITDLKKSILDLRANSFFDEMTNLPNRKYFDVRLGEAALRSDRMKSKLGVFYLDLDGFSAVNDSLGHNQGDFIILQVSHRLRHVIRGFDTVARTGGDEFLLLIEGITSYQILVAICNRLHSIITKPYNLSTGEEVVLTANIGVSLYPEDGNDIEKIIECADRARARAKEAGKNCYQIFSMLE